jgi:hypothetical protein
MRRITEGWLGAIVAGACWCATAPALAQPIPSCDSLPNVVYGSGGSAQKPFVARVARVLAGLPTPTTIVYQSAGGACQGIYNLLDDSDATPPLTGNQPYWLPDGTERQCSAPITGARTTFALMGNTTDACAGVTPADVATLSDSLGPVGTVNFLVPNASSQQSISAEALYFVYGFGGVAGQVEPWTLDSAIGTRNANSFAAIFAALYAGVPLSRLATTGTDVMTNSGTVTFLNNAAAAGNAESAIAFASGEVADANRATVRTLALQGRDQTCAYWPDSSATTFDKINVRDGHYELWAASHFYARAVGGVITHEPTRNLIGWITGTIPAPAGLDVLDLTIANRNVPQCAMRVARVGDLGALMSFVPPEPCGCYFEAQATGSTSCTACTTSAECAGTSSPVCRRGYCEVR